MPPRIDLSEPHAVEANLPSLLAEHGPPDVLVNNAGFGLYRPFLQHTSTDHHRLMQVNYFAAISMIRLVLPSMVQRKRGHIINVASMASKVGPWGHTGYAASKAALVSATQTLAAEHAADGLHFSYVNPGIVSTDYFATGTFVPLFERVGRRAVTADVVARQIVGLLDKPRLELCVPGSYRLLDWIRAMSPQQAHRLVAANSRPPVHQTTPAIPSTPPPAASRPVAEIRAAIDEESPAAAGRS